MRAIPTFVLLCTLFIQGFSQRFGQQNSFQRQQNNFQKPISQEQPRASSVNCPDKNGRYPTRTCDGYIECVDGVGEEKLCPDGLLFNPATGPFAFPCQYPIDVDCTGREQTQPAQPTEDCPHQFGYYRLGDSVNCGQFMQCAQGRSYTFDCPTGLAYDELTYRCDWPDQVQSCDAEAYLGFTCPAESTVREAGEAEFRFFRSPNDCQKYYICINGRPRLYNCGEGQAFNELKNECDGAENVTGCAENHNSQFDRTATKGIKGIDIRFQK